MLYNKCCLLNEFEKMLYFCINNEVNMLRRALEESNATVLIKGESGTRIGGKRALSVDVYVVAAQEEKRLF